MNPRASANPLRQLGTLRQTLRGVPGLLWAADARLTIWLMVTNVLQILIPLAQLWVAKLIIDRVVTAISTARHVTASHEILWLVAAQFALGALSVILREASTYQRTVLAERLTGFVSTRILTHAQRLDLETLERPEYYDHLRRAEEAAFYRPASLLFYLLSVLQSIITLVGAALLLTRLQPLALPLLLLTAIPYALVQSRAVTRSYSISVGRTPETRLARYYSQLLGTDVGAKEIRVFGLGEYLLRRYRAILSEHQGLMADHAWRRGLQAAAAALLPATAYAAIFAYLTLQALDRHITVGDLTLYAGLVLRSQEHTATAHAQRLRHP